MKDNIEVKQAGTKKTQLQNFKLKGKKEIIIKMKQMGHRGHKHKIKYKHSYTNSNSKT